MPLKSLDSDGLHPYNLHTRFLILQYCIIIAFSVLALRFWNMQVVQHDNYVRQAENNRLRDVPIPAPRGNILDRNGRILVDSRPTFNLMINREDITEQDATIRMLVEEFGVDREYVIQQLHSQAAKSRPIEVKIDITDA
ncbi:MAG TPA: hypothetical protein PKZ53_14960, partial [Acidobacteriota bacterium]|nr:hypothetical protein [Acidobacteriota bacterium]